MYLWCLNHPWMTFIIIIIIIFSINLNFMIIYEGKRRKIENLNIEGGIKMPNKNGMPKNINGSNKGKPNNSTKIIHEQRGSIDVPPTTLSSPGKPPKQK